MFPDRYLTGVLYREIVRHISVPFARQHLGDNYRYQENSTTPHRARILLDFLQQGKVTKMEQFARSPNCNPIENIWDELGRAITGMGNPPRDIGELCQAMLGEWAEIPVELLHCLVTNMPRCLAVIIAASVGNTRY